MTPKDKFKSAYSVYRKYRKQKTSDSRMCGVINDILSGALNSLAYMGIGINADGELYRCSTNYLVLYELNRHLHTVTLKHTNYSQMIIYINRLYTRYKAYRFNIAKFTVTDLNRGYVYTITKEMLAKEMMIYERTRHL